MGVETIEAQRQIQVVLYDLGGTLFHDDPAAWESIYRRADRALWDSLHASGVRATPEILDAPADGLLDYYYQFRAAGMDEPGTARLLRVLLTKHGISFSESSLERALAAMYAVTQTNWFVEDDAVATLKRLRSAGIRQGVVSNGSDDANARRLLEKGHLDPFFEIVLTSAAFGRRKPDPAIFRAALAQFGAAPHESVMVGDDYGADIAGARGIGMGTIWVTRRVPAAQVDAAPRSEAKASCLAEIPALIV